jgi:hypothetical protein
MIIHPDIINMFVREYNLAIISSGVIEFYLLLYLEFFLHDHVSYFAQVIEYVKACNTRLLKDFPSKCIMICLLTFLMSFHEIPISSRTFLKVQIVYEMNVVLYMQLLHQLIVLWIFFHSFSSTDLTKYSKAITKF